MRKETIFSGILNILCSVVCFGVFFFSWNVLCIIALPFMQMMFLLWLATAMIGIFVITPPGIMFIAGIETFTARKQKMHLGVLTLNSLMKLVNCAFNAKFSFEIFKLGNSQYVINGILFAFTVILLLFSIFVDFYALYKSKKVVKHEK